MNGSNAWDLLRETPARQHSRSKSPSSRSRVEPEIVEETMAEAASAPDEVSLLLEEDTRRRLSERKRSKSKSPAADTFHKVGRNILEKVGIKRKRSYVETHLLSTFRELPWIELTLLCLKPITYTYERSVDSWTGRRGMFETSSSFGSRSRLESTDRQQEVTEERCAYLFRSESSNHEKERESLSTVAEDEEVKVYRYDPYCPVHGSRRRITPKAIKLNRLKKYNSAHLTSIDTLEMTETQSMILSSSAYAAKILRKRRRAQLSEGDHDMRNEKEKYKIKWNLWIISFAFLFLFTAFHGLQNLQSSVNGHLGSDGLCTFYLSLAISSLFVPTFMINRLGCKVTLVAACGIHMIYMLANFQPKFYFLIPASVLGGTAGSCLWAAKCQYITECGIRYAQLNVESQNVVIVRFFGYFFMIVHLGQVSGNLISTVILRFDTAIEYRKPMDYVEKTFALFIRTYFCI